jgi:ParB-like chromosome segregation protein Spo0J
VSGGDSYPLDLASPVSHVAAKLDGAAPAALSLAELTAGYRHPNTGDLARVRNLEGCDSDDAATAWLIERALAEITYRGKARQVEQHDGSYRLTDGLTLDDLRWKRKRIYEVRNDHAQLRDPFNPMSGRFSENVRRDTRKDGMTELRESMRSFGWVPELPAVKDERGVVLAGHRRLKVAAELGIDPVVTTVRLGDGDAADARRFAIAIASNLGAKPFTPQERQHLAEYLYGEREWTMARIAEALKVSIGTVSGDLRDFSTTEKRKGPGRPRKSPNRKVIPEMEAEVAQAVGAGQPVPSRQLAAKYDVHPSTVEDRAREERARAEERERVRQALPPPLEASTCTCPTCGVVHTLP